MASYFQVACFPCYVLYMTLKRYNTLIYNVAWSIIYPHEAAVESPRNVIPKKCEEFCIIDHEELASLRGNDNHTVYIVLQEPPRVKSMLRSSATV